MVNQIERCETYAKVYNTLTVWYKAKPQLEEQLENLKQCPSANDPNKCVDQARRAFAKVYVKYTTHLGRQLC